MQIQWYPGHMAKARRMLAESVKLVDVIIEMVDARAPASTRNPDFDDLFRTRPRVVVLNKADLVNETELKEARESIRAITPETAIICTCAKEEISGKILDRIIDWEG